MACIPRAADSAIKAVHMGKTWMLTFTKLFFDHSEFICHCLVTCKPRLINSGASRHCALLLHQMNFWGNLSGEFCVSFQFINVSIWEAYSIIWYLQFQGFARFMVSLQETPLSKHEDYYYFSAVTDQCLKILEIKNLVNYEKDQLWKYNQCVCNLNGSSWCQRFDDNQFDTDMF